MGEVIFDEGLAIIHDELMREIKNHFSTGETTKQTSLNIALQYMNSGMMKAVIYEREKLKSKLEKAKDKLQSILDEKWILLKVDQDRLLNKVSEALKEIEGLG